MSSVHSNSVIPMQQRPLDAVSESTLPKLHLPSNRLIPERPRSVQFLSTIRFKPLPGLRPPAGCSAIRGHRSPRYRSTSGRRNAACRPAPTGARL